MEDNQYSKEYFIWNFLHTLFITHIRNQAPKIIWSDVWQPLLALNCVFGTLIVGLTNLAISRLINFRNKMDVERNECRSLRRHTNTHRANTIWHKGDLIHLIFAHEHVWHVITNKPTSNSWIVRKCVEKNEQNGKGKLKLYADGNVWV